MSAEPLYPLFVSESVHIPIEHESGCNNDVWMFGCLSAWPGTTFLSTCTHSPAPARAPPGQNLHDVVTTGSCALCAHYPGGAALHV